ncbi:alpha-ketoglutarate-dependent dioxygenase AlkB [Xanthomonas floridensis]|uniref:Alpha-ketoglutarate-dependent dioxygenase AlkB n=1 Tax=Xanthomonas floridensis TaxID=1843580 RepID=A0A1A9M8M1_9XANT|nr:alpha-ketoglutarate-dependent dioxygenase AlkB [Xanthomonas floridensis]MEA5123200.1 alpha-ketoglutarate-dependent dioxygenase AlkB [Xanthomonas floridensis]MEA5130774.1 alpha-ketoglutarate-dependent dioxygenase AlkB [Xanthomonas floridensis]OAG66844.1 DNA-3-methyladenine glycosylase [Xanthomonas floridensis]
MDLFETPNAPLQVIDDAEGGVRYWPQLLAPELAQACFRALRDGVSWQSQRREMYDRVVEVPRLLASYALDAALPPALPLLQLRDAVQAVLPAPYNAVGLNLYRDGRDSVAMHHDKLQTLVAPYPIALVSLGSARRMTLRGKDASARATALELAPGSLLAMSHASQLTHEHGIAKTARAVGERVSVVFRVRPAARMAAGQHGPHWAPVPQ